MPTRRFAGLLGAPAAWALGWAASAAGHVNPWPDPHVVLHACEQGLAQCGEVERPLDPDGQISGAITIHFEFYRHSGDGASQGTLVATEGGPGYPATRSRADYLALFEPLMAHRDVLIMDNRGTGRSGAIDCPALQTGDHWTVELVAACGESLGDRAPLYSTEYAADDLAAILAALELGKIDLYGDSYGTYFEQVFAVRHPERLRSLVLDGAFPLTGPDYAWYPSYAPAMRDKFNRACARSAACAALPGSSLDHIRPALEALRAAPFTATGYDIDGQERRFHADAAQLAIVMFASAPALTSAREVDAAARAFSAGDRLPLLRLMAETAAAVDSRDPTADATQWSAGLAAAVLCQDPPQIFDMRLPPDARRRELDRVLAERRRTAPGTYAPFTLDEYRAMPLDYSFLDECVGWPVGSAAHPAGRVGMNAVYPDVPALVISGEFDDITTAADAAQVAATFDHGLLVRVANSFHVNALPRARSECGAQIARRFIVTLDAGDTSCASQVPPLQLVPRFAAESRQLAAAAALPGNAAPTAALQAATAAVLTAEDLLARADYNTSGRGVGLRGGSYRVTHNKAGVRLTLDRIRWTEDVAVSGTVLRPEGRRVPVRGSLTVLLPSGTRGRLTVTWFEGVDHGTVAIRGSIGGTKVIAESPAP